MFHATLIIMIRQYFFGFQSPHLPFAIQFWTRGFPLNVLRCPLITQKTRPLSHRIQKRTGHWRTDIMRIFRSRFWTQGFPFVMRSRKACLPFATRVRQCLSESANVRPRPQMSVRVRQCPSMSANVPKNTSVVL